MPSIPARAPDPDPARIRARLRAEKRHQAEEQLARAARVGKDFGIENLRDLGPALRLARGEVEREFRPDPDYVTRPVLVRGARVRDGLRNMLAKGEITGEAWKAAERFRDDVALAYDGRSGGPNLSGVRASFTAARSLPAESQLDAMARVR